MLVVNRFRVPSDPSDAAVSFRADLAGAHDVLASQAGYVGGEIGRNLDEPDLWVLTTRWESVGAYRRALSSYEVKLSAVPILSRAIDEPSAFELVEPGTELNRHEARTT